MIIACRIDGRLVHGQVANLWTPKLSIERIIVVDDKVSESKIDKAGLRLATPNGVRLSVLPVARAAKQINEDRYKSQRVLIVAKTPDIFLELVEAGVPIEEINVGNMSQTEETTAINNSINVVQKDVDDFHQLVDHGVKLIAQMAPSDPAKEFMPLLESKFKS
ncbi:MULTISPECIES: PTS sugar transporter subunit IIB [Aerococcus]|uniref:PTS sugar transporter subunit IIB n=1 Tax=Aerococcus sanguinicola TaxID=119206 RepID=A0A5N1GIK2_9LACT|nr:MULTISPECIES: PTS sugar transporter subunit IIB [Aerococcus]KAA9300166.1 PTS sugar transporter subunit IIB [Aerococcus sanguinicola]MDK6369508.1 PTS sugar transporter subunit IIB [Aerococcus sp. UMB9870]MDK6679995.1 PTS sugar transporter subunit IIB [Aerococcus sp. UMB8608]MDK6686123.1 PTS sugar transporter subunit IIB [Aerococcus sp. UMB8623]MDK6939903.1 PTS sugar transporter subunit IIB [Aerococcus sp. UMB8487]